MYQAGDPFPHPALLDNYRTVLNQRITLSDYQGVEVGNRGSLHTEDRAVH